MIALLAAMLGSAALAQTPTEILMVGNSYTSRNALPQLSASWLTQTVPDWDVAATSSTAGGKTLPQHADDLGADTALAQYLVSAPADWLWVSLQDQSQIPGFPTTEPTWQASRDAALELAAAVRATGSEPVFFQTWGRRTGDAQNPDLYPDYASMQDRITSGYADYRDAAAVDGSAWIAPVGEVFRAIHDGVEGEPAVEGTAFWELYSADDSHPSVAGSAAAAATFVATTTGRRPAPLGQLVDQGLDTDRQELLLDAVQRVVLDDPEGPVPYPWVHPIADFPEGSPVGTTAERPLVLFTSDDLVDRDGIALADARLWFASGTHTIRELTVVDGAPGVVLLRAGLVTHTLDLGTTGVLDWRQGTLAPVEVVGSVVVPADGELQLVAGSSVSITGALSGVGRVVYEGAVPEEGLVVLEASGGLDPSGLQIAVPEGADWEIQGGTQLFLFPSSGAGREPAGGCGCDSAPIGPAWGIALLGLLLTRRRDKSGGRLPRSAAIC